MGTLNSKPSISVRGPSQDIYASELVRHNSSTAKESACGIRYVGLDGMAEVEETMIVM